MYFRLRRPLEFYRAWSSFSILEHFLPPLKLIRARSSLSDAGQRLVHVLLERGQSSPEVLHVRSRLTRAASSLQLHSGTELLGASRSPFEHWRQKIVPPVRLAPCGLNSHLDQG